MIKVDECSGTCFCSTGFLPSSAARLTRYALSCCAYEAHETTPTPTANETIKSVSKIFRIYQIGHHVMIDRD